MPLLEPNPTLSIFQDYVKKLELERGFNHQTVKDKCIMLGEEVGELFKAIRKKEGLEVDPNSSFSDIGEEITDIFIFLCSIANRYYINIVDAFRSKEEKNHKRQWVSHPEKTEQ